MFGSEPLPRRPVLLLLVFGAFLAIVGITATAQSTMVSADFQAVALQAIVGGDAATVRTFASSTLTTGDLASGNAIPAAHQADLDQAMRSITGSKGVLRVELHRADGTLIAADRPATVTTAPPAASTASAADIVLLADSGASVGDLSTPWLLRERLPITDAATGQLVATVSVWRDAVPILAQLDEIRTRIILVTITAGVIATVLLFLIFRSAQGRLTRQTGELVRATHTDPLTGTLNHGALVELLATRIEAARVDGSAVGIALIDVDNFTLLNDHHGNHVGDTALLTVLEVLRAAVSPDAVFGRYGPDEFLVIAPMATLHALEPSMQALRTGLADRSLDVDAPDRLPITISAGIASYPRDASSLTVLLATVASTLGAARASGGDDVRVAGMDDDGAAPGTSSFDVLQGLVFAVDTKDRYTKRHSEDVARYAIFLAQQLGLDEATIATIRLSGLLHDVGKIGIPDSVLRKPGKLTTEEYEIVKQHVILGDMIVRDLPDVDIVRAGIRHHHERWDGQGYVDHLSGEGIPLIARILAVGDTFSAMTTSRPYRKALDVPEAIRRLEDAAGTQLDERLVTAFVTGLETAADPPLPGADPSIRLWTPRAVA